MSPALDSILVAAAILGALGYFIARSFFSRKKGGCATGCGCATPKRGVKPRQ
jgi:hypothetical protein